MLRRRYSELDLGLGGVAEEVGCSPRQLQWVFQEEGATGFRSTLLAFRMERARHLLSREFNPLPIRRVALLVGYRQASGLRQAFLRYHGYNPSTIQPEPREELWMEPGRRAAGLR